MLEGVSWALMVAVILRKVIPPFIQLHARRSFLSANGSWHFEKSHFTVPFSHAEGFSRAGMVAGILRKVILPLPPLYARIIFSSENGRWHFGKSNFPTKKISQATVERGIS
jgi:hypothetical protein|tara:strand:+ start:384 stop:716 length:333 start_codon:yes stop_codon:yes gene_type:complete